MNTLFTNIKLPIHHTEYLSLSCKLTENSLKQKVVKNLFHYTKVKSAHYFRKMFVKQLCEVLFLRNYCF